MNKDFFVNNKGKIIGIAIVAIIFFFFIGKYNSFVKKNEAITGQWAQVDNQLQRRFDLIPNIVSTVKGIAKQEKDIFGAISNARTHYSGATTIDEKAQAAGQVESAIGRLLVITENYPELKSSESFRDLTVELEGTENRISVERMKYNDLVKDLNTSIQTFPSSLVASMFGVKAHSYFEIAKEATAVPKVDFTQ